MTDPQLVVYEKDTCTTCRKLFTLLCEQGVDYSTVEYHVTGLTEPEIRDLLMKLRANARDVLRLRKPLVKELGLDDPERGLELF
jgi:arsenate reductase